MNTKAILGAAILLKLYAADGEALAQTKEENIEKSIQLDEQEAKLNGRLNRVDQVGANLGRFKLIRDTYVNGESGLKTITGNWSAKANGWVSKWQESLLVLDGVSSDMPANLQDSLRKLILEQVQTWWELKSLSQEIQQKREATYGLVEKLEPVKAVPDEQYGQQIQALNSAVAQLQTAIKASDAYYGSEMTKTWDETVRTSKTIIQTKLKLALLKNPALERVIKVVVEMLEAESAFAPKLSEADRLYREFREHTMAKRVFAAEKSLKLLTDYVDAASKEVSDSAFDVSFKNPVLETLANKKKAAIGLIQQSIRPFPKHVSVTKNFESSGTRYAEQCRQPEKAKTLNCEKFRRIFATPKAAIKSMNDAQLEFLEKEIETIKKGPLG